MALFSLIRRNFYIMTPISTKSRLFFIHIYLYKALPCFKNILHSIWTKFLHIKPIEIYIQEAARQVVPLGTSERVYATYYAIITVIFK